MELMCRNAELEVELRMVKEELAQARQSTQYLLQLFSRSPTNLGSGHVDNGNPQLQLEASKRISRRDSIVDALSRQATVDATPEYTLDAQLVTFDPQRPLLDDGTDEHLLNTPSLVPVKDTKSGEPAQDSVGLGIISDDPMPSTRFSGLSTRAATGFSFRKTDGTSVFVPTPTIGMSPESSFAGVPAAEISGNEHRSLAGKACFWADMDAEGLTKALAWYAKGSRHTAEDYRTYFEDVIRPEYEGKMKRLQATRGAFLAPFGESQTRGRTLSREDGEEKTAAKTGPSAAQAEGQASSEAQLSEHVEEVVAETEPENPPEAASSEQLSDVVFDSAIDTAPETREKPKLSARESYRLYLLDFEATATDCVVKANVPAAIPLDKEVPAANAETNIGGYIPPRLYNPSALEDAKNLRAEYQRWKPTGRGRERRARVCLDLEPKSSRCAEPCDRPGLAAEDPHHPPPGVSELISSRHAVCSEPGAKGPYRPPHQDPSYIAYPMEVEELFATPAEGDRSPYRTVLISNIPAGTMLIDVLDSIKGGKIYSAVLLDTAGMRTTPPIDTNSALITFVFGRHARLAAESWSNPKFNTTAQLLRTISRPIPARVMSDVLQNDLSRVLFVYDAQQTWASEDVADRLMRNGAQYPLKSESDGEVPGLMLFHYANLAEARTAWLAVGRDHTFFGEVNRGFFADPCGKPIEKSVAEELMEEAEIKAQKRLESEKDQVEQDAGDFQEGRVDFSMMSDSDWSQKYEIVRRSR